MKFGDTLYQRSVPEWSINNIDYNEIKHSIKIHTSNDQSRPQAIPNGNFKAEEAQQLEDRLYVELYGQHDRVNEFIQVKAGELSRRLTALEKQVVRLSADCTSRGANGLSVKRAEKFARLDAGIQRAGNDVDALSRFTQANSLAIRKILKKYRKWTGSRVLEQRFRSNVLDQDTSISKRNFVVLFAQYTEILETLRTAHIRASQRRPSNATPVRGSNSTNQPPGENSTGHCFSAVALHEASEKGSPVEFDVALALTPLGNGATRAAYWVHQDNFMNVQILLLRHMSQRKVDEDPSLGATTACLKGSRRESAAGSPTIDHQSEAENYGLIILDELQRFAECRSSETISDIERLSGKAAEKAIASLTLSNSDDVLIAIDEMFDENNSTNPRLYGHNHVLRKAKKKDVRNLFCTSNSEIEGTLSKDELSDVSRWYLSHPEIKPLVKISGHRGRFCGLANSLKGGLWATLDKDVNIRRCSAEAIKADRSMLNIGKSIQEGNQRFPYAILEVRVEGNGPISLLKALDESHLAERVRGFSIETHAVAALCSPLAMPPPYWIPTLERDIRKVPNLSTGPNERGQKTRFSSEQASTAHTSLSAPSTRDVPSSSAFSPVHGESSATSAPEAPDILEASPMRPFKKKRKGSKRSKPPRKLFQGSQQPPPKRYWNEFDDGSEGEQHQAYTICVDPNASSTFPVAAINTKLWERIAHKLEGSKHKVAGWFYTTAASDPEREPLNNSIRSSPEDSEASDDEAATLPAKRHYSTFSSRSKQKPDSTRETVLFRSCISSFASSYLLLLIAVILLSTGRRKAATEVDAGVVIGVSAAFVFAIIGVGSMMARRTDLGWVHRTTILLLSLCVFLAGLALLVMMNKSSR